MEKEIAKELDQETVEKILAFQRDEITEYHIYNKLASRTKGVGNKKVLKDIARDEREHYYFWKNYSQESPRAKRWKILFYYWISVIFGLTFGIKLMERGEENAQVTYSKIISIIPEAEKIMIEEEEHEHELINLLEEEHLQYIGSIVLGLNDALVELTGTLAGLSFALKNTDLIALTGVITGIAASLSMGASEYLSSKSEGNDQALKSSIYTGVAYIITVVLLVLPYLLVGNYLLALIMTIVVGILIILVFNFYIAIARDLNFKKRFLEMASISIGVAFISFLIGLLIRVFIGVDI